MPVEPVLIGSDSAHDKGNTDQCDYNLGDRPRSGTFGRIELTKI
jgi:hypothetical protein